MMQLLNRKAFAELNCWEEISIAGLLKAAESGDAPKGKEC